MTEIPFNVMMEILRTDFVAFLQKCFQTLHPNETFHKNWHHEAIAYELARCGQGLGHNLLVVNLPPRHLKSEIIAVAYTAWLLGHEPGASIISVSYGADLVKRFSRQTRQIMESDWYKAAFPDTRISPEKNTETEFETTAGGRRYATTMRGELTGHGAKYIVVDDPHNVAQRPSAEELKSAWEWFHTGLYTRLTCPEEGAIIVVMQRYHPNDLTGYLLHDAGFRQLKLEAVASEDKVIPLGDGAEHVRKKGDVLHPGWRSKKVLEQDKEMLGPDAFEAQFQQNPMLGGGSLFKPEYFPVYDRVLRRHNYEFVLQTWDAASSLSEDCSYSVCMTFGVCEDQLHLLHVHRARLEYPKLLATAMKLIDLFGPSHIWIEYASLGQALFADLRQKFLYGIYTDHPKTDKQERAEGVLHLVTKGRVALPKQAMWRPAFDQEVFAFPGAPHDDQVDALVLALYVLRFNCLNNWPIDFGDERPSLGGYPKTGK